MPTIDIKSIIVRCTCGDKLRVATRNYDGALTVKPCLNCTSAAWEDGFGNRKPKEKK